MLITIIANHTLPLPCAAAASHQESIGNYKLVSGNLPSTCKSVYRSERERESRAALSLSLGILNEDAQTQTKISSIDVFYIVIVTRIYYYYWSCKCC